MTDEKQHADLPSRIRKEATRLFACHGYAGTTLRQLTRACDCTKAACYYHYHNKAGVYEEVVSYNRSRAYELVRRAFATTGTCRRRLHDGLDSVVEFAMENPTVCRLLIRCEFMPEAEAPRVEGSAVGVVFVEALHDVVREGYKELQTSISVSDAAQLLAGSIFFQLCVSIECGVWDRPRMHRTLDMAVDGMVQTNLETGYRS